MCTNVLYALGFVVCIFNRLIVDFYIQFSTPISLIKAVHSAGKSFIPLTNVGGGGLIIAFLI